MSKMVLKKLVQSEKNKQADLSMSDHKQKGLVVEYDNIQYLTKKGLQEAIRLRQLLTLLEENRVSDE